MVLDEDKFILTPEGYANIQRQLADLEARVKDEREVLADATNDSLGGEDDDSDVAANFDAHTRKEWTDQKIGHLRYILDRAEIYEDPNPSQIDVGERVTLWDFQDRRKIQLDLISRAEVTTSANADPNVTDASDDSPMGQALLGRSVGDIIEVETPDGRMRFAVRKIDSIPAK